MEFVAVIFTYLFVALAIAAASITLTRARLFEPARTWTLDKSWLAYKFISCPYCMAHWLALLVTPTVLYQLTQVVWLDALLTWFALVGGSALFEGLIMNGLLMQEHLIQELEEEAHDRRGVMLDLAADLRSVRQASIAPEEYERAKEQAYRNGQIDGQNQERERYAAMEVRLREPLPERRASDPA